MRNKLAFAGKGEIGDQSLRSKDRAANFRMFCYAMQHRHLNHQEFTLAALDDIIRRGGARDWVLLRRAAHRDAALLARIQRLCSAAAASPAQEGAQRISFWRKYARRLTATVG